MESFCFNDPLSMGRHVANFMHQSPRDSDEQQGMISLLGGQIFVSFFRKSPPKVCISATWRDQGCCRTAPSGVSCVMLSTTHHRVTSVPGKQSDALLSIGLNPDFRICWMWLLLLCRGP